MASRVGLQRREFSGDAASVPTTVKPTCQGSRRQRSPLGLHTCDGMREPLAEPRSFRVNRSRVAARNRRRDRSVDRWHQAMVYDKVCRKRVWLLLFTTSSPDPAVVEGQMRRFWHAVRDRFGKQQYWAGLEVQQRGAAHYHVMWVDPAMADTRETKQWLEKTWGLGFVKLKQRSRTWFDLTGATYIKSEIKASEGKAYQHDYSAIPSTVKTCMYGELEFLARDLDAHRDSQLVAYVPPRPYLLTSAVPGAELAEVDRELLELGGLVQWGVVRHVECCRGACTLWRFRRNVGQNKAPRNCWHERGALHRRTRVSTTRDSSGRRNSACWTV